jgi:hypothetical protein
MSRSAQGVVAIVFFIMGLSFIATTSVLYSEFRDHDWFAIAAFYSHLFIFFPTYGILALCAFFIPASVFLDLYWHHVKFGKVRFVVALLALVLVSVGVSRVLVGGDIPAVWWMHPTTLQSDPGEPANCAAQEGQCRRLPVMTSLREVRRISQARAGLSPFVRECKPDPLMELSTELLQKRYCFITKTKLTAAECCASQTVFTVGIAQLYANERNHSVTGKVHATLLPFKIFFLLMILVIGVLLAVWRRTIDRLYKPYTQRIERGLLIGAFAMLLWPISNHGFLQSASLLYGKFGEGVYATISPLLSLLFVAWALFLVLFFFRGHERDVEAAGKIGGGIASAVAIVKYNEIIDYATRFLGSGADPIELAVMGGLMALAFGALYTGLPNMRGAGAIINSD